MIQPIGNLLPRLVRQRHRGQAQGEGGVITITPTEPGLQQRIANAIGAAIETVRRRVDAMGTAEAQIVRQGSEPHPGAGAGAAGHRPAQGADRQDGAPDLPRGAPDDLGRARRSKTRVPAGYRIYPGGDREEGAQLLRETPVVRGEELVDAQPGFDQRTNEPIISFRFNNVGCAQVRQVHQGQRRPPVRHRARRQGDLGARDPRADPRRLGPDQRQLHGRDRQPARHPAALRRAAGQADDRRGAHGRALARRRLDRGRQARRHRRRHRHRRLDDLSPTARSASSPWSACWCTAVLTSP